jgi:glycosyltransferase involved in cell wall biosynthesis
MHPVHTTVPSKRKATSGINIGILWVSCCVALVSYFVWNKYLLGALIVAMFFLVVLIARVVIRFALVPKSLASEMEKAESLISIIICSIDPIKYGLVCDNLRMRLGDSPYEVIGIHDAKSLCEGYNRGIKKSRGDILVFCHDDIDIISPSFSSLLRNHLQTADVIGCAGTTLLKDSRWMSSGDPHVHGVIAYPAANAWPSDLFHVSVWGGPELTPVRGIQALDGFFIAANRRVVESVQFDEKTFDGFHGYDTDFTYAAFLHGFEIAVCKDILIAHKSTVGDFEGVYKTFASRFQEKYKDHLAEKADDGLIEQVDFPYVSQEQMLKVWS